MGFGVGDSDGMAGMDCCCSMISENSARTTWRLQAGNFWRVFHSHAWQLILIGSQLGLLAGKPGCGFFMYLLGLPHSMVALRRKIFYMTAQDGKVSLLTKWKLHLLTWPGLCCFCHKPSKIQVEKNEISLLARDWQHSWKVCGTGTIFVPSLENITWKYSLPQ